ncbi:MAG TPA: VOC family protein [Burkholderiales bacterium]|nr:VOC family protein [Burkholderiales bacterium]
MPALTDLRCVLAVKDLAVSVAFYRERLGFNLDFEVPGWAFLSRDRFRVMLGECADAMAAHETGDHSYFAYVTVDGIDELYREFVEKGVLRVQDLSNKPWGMREFGVRTPDGHRIMFGQGIPT